MPRMTDDKNARLADIGRLIIGFCDRYLDEEYENFCMNLAIALSRKRKVDIRRGKSEQWAASIVYVIARLNFLYDKKNPVHVTVKDICDYFDVKKSTTGNKASQIEMLCDVNYGREEYCVEAIRDMFTFHETEDGFIVPKSLIDRQVNRLLATYGLLDEHDDDEEEKTPALSIEDQRKLEKERALDKAREKSVQKHKDENQIGLFDN